MKRAWPQPFTWAVIVETNRPFLGRIWRSGILLPGLAQKRMAPMQE